MMMPRLKLLKELLKEDGIIFVSIDNNEIHRLRLLMDEIFGEDNFISQIANINNPKGRSDDKYIPTAHEYILLYKKSLDPKLNGWIPEEKITKRYRNLDEDGMKWREIDLRKTGDNDLKEDRPNLFYYFLFNLKTKEFYPTKEILVPKNYIQIKPIREDGKDGNWRWELNNAKDNIAKLYPKLMPNRKVWSVFEKDYFDENEKIKPTTVWDKKEFNTERGTEAFLKLGFDKNDFPKPKPIGLIKHIIELASENDDIILDSFAGSGTTAQAVLELNKEDGGNRKFILVEMEDYANDITAERVRRIIKGIPKDDELDLENGTGGTFSFFELGDPIEMESILKGDSLPTYNDLARYVFYTATGEQFNPKKVNEKKNYIGETKEYEVYLFYKPDLDYLRSTALTLKLAQSLGRYNGKKKLVFAPAKYVDTHSLLEFKIEYCQLPFEIYRIKE
jgi:adenine-specific DNA-methyltransferase